MSKISLFTCLLLLAACGLQEPDQDCPDPPACDDAGTPAASDSGTPTDTDSGDPADADADTPADTDSGTPTDTDSGTPTTPDPCAPDIIGPALAVTSPADGFGTEDETVEVNGTVSDNCELSDVQANGVECVVSGTNYSCDVILPEAGTVRITVVAVDKAANKTTAAVSVTRYLPAPFRTRAVKVLEMANLYSDGSVYGYLRGGGFGSYSPAINWTTGPECRDTDQDGYLEYTFVSPLPVGVHEVTWVNPVGTYANYGAKEFILLMSLEARKWLGCCWLDRTTGDELPAPAGGWTCGCSGYVEILATGEIKPAGWAHLKELVP